MKLLIWTWYLKREEIHSTALWFRQIQILYFLNEKHSDGVLEAIVLHLYTKTQQITFCQLEKKTIFCSNYDFNLFSIFYKLYTPIRKIFHFLCAFNFKKCALFCTIVYSLENHFALKVISFTSLLPCRGTF